MAKIRYYDQKDWFRNMNNIVTNYKHKGEANDMYLIHMVDKCRIDRQGVCPGVWRWR